jgi:DNA polymerase-3 subunit beta
MNAQPIEQEDAIPSDNPKSKIQNPKFQFSVPVRELKEAVAELRKVAKSNSHLPVLGTVLVERDRGITRFTATDLDLRLQFTVPSELPEPTSDLGKQLLAKRSEREDGAVCVPIKDLGVATKNADKASDVLFTPDGLTYTFGGNKANLSGEFLPAEEFPPGRSDVGEAISFPEKARDAIIAAYPSAGEDESRYITMSVFVDATTNAAIVATDGRSLTAFDIKAMPMIGQLVIPKEAVRILSGRMAKSSWTIAVAENAIEIRAYNWTLQTKLVEGNYPNWRQVIPGEDKSQIAIPLTIFSRSEITELLKRLPRDPKAVNDPVKVHVNGSTLKFSVGDSAFTVSVPVKASPPRYVCANRKFWQRAVDLGATELRITNELSPVVAHNRNGLTFVFMPVRMG